ncbi:MAG TPA: family 20 glycosylhydrolase [Terriglobia bacterium]|nr:family 20 glycosylhydrolase [Terriglobia bacterium]
MRIHQRFLLIVLCLAASMSALAAHNPLLPRPQWINYGAGHLAVRGLAIEFASPPGPEDRFAADQLAMWLGSRAGAEIPIREKEGSGPAIVLERTGAVDPLPVPGDRPGPDSREAYELKVTPTGVTVRARSSAGIFYGAETLRQLMEGEGQQAVLPEVEIRDWPSLAYRGTMVDMSHGPLPKVQEVEQQLDFLARWKANQYYFYSEDSIELKGYPLINPEGRFTQDQVRTIIDYARQRHIDVVPCLELYGHRHDIFRVERYSSLSDLPHGTEFDPRNPQVMKLLANWINQFADLFPSPFVHIGFDETFQIQIAVKQQGTGATPTKLFVNQLNNVARLFEKRGKHVMAWADIMVKYPEILPQMPPGIIAVPWHYRAQPDSEYKQWLAPLTAGGVPHIVATGVTSWNQIAPDYDTTFDNIDTFLAAGRKSRALGLMDTVWTDDGQMLMRMSWPGIAYGAVAPWQSAVMDRATFFSDYARLMYPAAVASDVSAALDDLRKSESTLQKVLGGSTMIALWRDPFDPQILKKCTEGESELRQARLLAEDAQERLDHAINLGGDRTTLESLLLGSRLLDYAGQKFQTAPELEVLWQRLGPTRPASEIWWNEWGSMVIYQDHSRLVDLMDAITELRAQYRSAWLEEYTPYRLASAIGRWNAEYEYWRQMQSRLLTFSESSHEGDKLPPLASFAGPH